jgi:hypothetical protein
MNQVKAFNAAMDYIANHDGLQPERQPKVFRFYSSGDAYDACQYRDDIKNGDILVIEREGVVGLAWAWPIAVSLRHGNLHTPKPGMVAEDVPDEPKTIEAMRRARPIAEAIADELVGPFEPVYQRNGVPCDPWPDYDPTQTARALNVLHDENIVLRTEAEWQTFVSHNKEAIESDYGSVEAAWLQAGNGGLVFGGGAAPITHVRFANDGEAV